MGGKSKDPFDMPDYVQPTDPPKVAFHGQYGIGKSVPEEYRRIFGTNPPEKQKRPVPPPPPPPNSYHKKPKYWQMRGTSYMQPHNRIAGVVTVVVGALLYVLYKYDKAGNRFAKRMGSPITLEEQEEYEKKNRLFWEMMTKGIPADTFEVDPTGTKFHNPRRKDKDVRWDLREVDERVMGIKDMANPMDDPL